MQGLASWEDVQYSFDNLKYWGMGRMKNSYMELVKSLQTKRLIIFGAGRYFSEFSFWYQELLGYTESILDNKYEKENILSLDCTDILLMPPHMVTRYDINKYVVLFCSRYATEMKAQLDSYIQGDYEYYIYPFFTLDCPDSDKNVVSRVIDPITKMIEGHDLWEDVLCLTGCSSREMFQQKLIDREYVVIPRLVIVLTERCTLRCRECDNLMRHFKAPKSLDVDLILDSLQKIVDTVDVLPFCELIGGEPFLAGSLRQVLEFLLKEEKVLRIEITTNGTVLPKREDISVLRNNKVVVRLSDYRNIIDQKGFIDHMKANGIRFELIPSGKWIANGSVAKRERNTEDLMYQYDRCYSARICKTLWEDRLFVCTRAASLAALGHTDKEQSLKIDFSEDLRKDLWQFLCNPLIDACDYCDTESGTEKMTEPAEQMA